MHPKLKYLFFLPAFVACLTSSCNSDTADDIILSKGAEMSFDVLDLSRSSVTTDIDKFVVYADMKSRAQDQTSQPIVLFYNTPVERSNGQWRYSGVQYWVPTFEHSFVAVSPVSVIASDAFPSYSDSRLSFEYSIPATGGNLSSNSDVADILVATHRRYIDKDTEFDNKVTFKFSHILSLINISPAFYDNSLSSDDYIQIHAMTLSGIPTKARFEVFPATLLSNDLTDDKVINIEIKEEGNLNITLPTPVKVENNAVNVNLFASDDAIIMLPRQFAADTEAKITLYYTVGDDDTMSQLVLPLSNLQWESGKSYTYRFTFDRTSVIYDGCEINTWNTITGEEITVD